MPDILEGFFFGPIKKKCFFFCLFFSSLCMACILDPLAPSPSQLLWVLWQGFVIPLLGCLNSFPRG